MTSATSISGSGRRRVGIALAVSGLLLISLESPGIRLAQANVWDAAFFMGGFMAISMFLWLGIQRRSPFIAGRRGLALPLYLSAVMQGATTVLFILALHLTTVANTVVLFATTPAIGAAFAWVVIRERTPVRTWVGIAGSGVGIAIVVSESFGQGRLLGDLCALAAVVTYAANLTLWRRYPSLDRQAIIGLGGFALALATFVPADPGAIGARSLGFLAALGLVTAPLARISLASSTRYLPVSQVGLLTGVETVAATTWAWLLLGEVPNLAALVGGAVILTSVAVGVSE